MAWKGVHLSKPAYLSLLNANLQIRFKGQDLEDSDQTIFLPLEDIDYLILDTTEVSLSSPLIDALAKNSVLVLGVDERHMPSWISMPWASYYRQGSTLSLQLEASIPLKKQIWTKIIQKKGVGKFKLISSY